MKPRIPAVYADADTTPDGFFDALFGADVTCTACGQPGAHPRHWDTPHGPQAAFYCDDCETRVKLGLLRLRAGDYWGAVDAIQA